MGVCQDTNRPKLLSNRGHSNKVCLARLVIFINWKGTLNEGLPKYRDAV